MICTSEMDYTFDNFLPCNHCNNTYYCSDISQVSASVYRKHQEQLIPPHSRGCGVSVPLSRLWWCEVWSPAPCLGRGSLPRWPASWPRDTGHRDNYNNKHQVSSPLAHWFFLILWTLTPLFPILSFRASPWSRPTCSLDEWHYCESIKLQIFHKTCDRIS